MQRCGKIIDVNKICRRHGDHSNYSDNVTRAAQQICNDKGMIWDEAKHQEHNIW